MRLEVEKIIEAYYGKYKKGLFGKQHSIKLFIYPSHIEGNAFEYYDGNLSDDSCAFNISYESIKRMYVGKIKDDVNITIEYKDDFVMLRAFATIMLMGIDEPQKWLQMIETAKDKYCKELDKKRRIEIEEKEKQRRLEIQREETMLRFYQECFAFYIKEKTPVYQLFADKNKIALLYIDENMGLIFLKIDGYAEEENRGIITYDNIHYYEKAGNVHYTTDIHGNYSSFGGSMTGGSFSKLATMGGGLLFGLMGMAVGATLTYYQDKFYHWFRC